MTVAEAYSEVAERLARVNPLEISNLPSLESMSERVEELVHKKKDGNISVDETVELERYLSLDLLISLAKTKAKDMVTIGDNGHSSVSYNEKERALIKQIREGISLEITQRFDELNREQRERKLTNIEKEELIKLVDTIEGATVKRLENIMKLAQIWQVSADDVMEKLNIKAPEPYVW